ncbi:MAG TPA: DUF5666 domain-containing protein [Thermoanaerobaculia bacterium]|nr:DUF5666 domain-containing protein [Thermoanaerobaculia bacterium]
MRKVSILSLVLCLILGLSVVAMAKDAAKPAATKPAKGDVTNVNATDNSLTVKGKTADETFWTNDKTKITKDGKEAKLADVKVGDWAEVWSTAKDGKDWATKIAAKSPKNPNKK